MKTTLVRQGGTLTLQAAVKAPRDTVLHYAWRRDGVPLDTTEGRVRGEDTAKLVIAGLKAEDRGSYSCQIQMLTKTRVLLAEEVYPSARLEVVTDIPEITLPALPTVYVNEPVSIPVQAAEHPQRYSAAGLPPGVGIDSSTGVISGRPTLVKKVKGQIVPYSVKITVTNLLGNTTTAAIPWSILELPEELCGTFEGLVNRHESNQNLGGWIRLTITPAGMLTGHTIWAGKRLSFRGLTANTYRSTLIRLGTIELDIPNGKSPPVHLDLTVRKVGDVSRIGGTLAGVRVEGWQCPYSSQNRFNASGCINTALMASEDSAPNSDQAGYPRGDGFAVVKISSSGTVTWSGSLADGTAFTASHLLGCSDGTTASTATFLHAPLYTAAGSVQGDYAILPGPPLRLEGEADWVKNEQSGNVKSLDYASGFGPLDLSLRGQTYVRPASGTLVMDLDDQAEKNAILSLEGESLLEGDYANLGNSMDVVPAPWFLSDFGLKISSKGTAIYKPWNEAWTAAFNGKVSLTVTPASGQMRGSFYLGTPKGTVLFRGMTVPFYGLIVPHPEVAAGVGYFRVPKRTDGHFSTTGADVPYESGRVRVKSYALAAP